jgi:hypothetical protein
MEISMAKMRTTMTKQEIRSKLDKEMSELKQAIATLILVDDGKIKSKDELIRVQETMSDNCAQDIISLRECKHF